MESFVFYRSFYDAIKDLPAEDALACIKAICEYGLNGEDVAETTIAKVALTMARPQIDANNKRRESGRSGGKSSKAKQAEANASKAKQAEANASKAKQSQANVNVNDNVNVNVNTLVDDPELADAISRWLDARTAIGPYPYASITACIDTAKQNKSKFGTGACVRAINAAIEGGWKKIVWPDEKARSGTTKDHGFKQNEYDFDTLEKQLLGD